MTAEMTCPACEGAGEIITSYDRFGVENTVTCPRCKGYGGIPEGSEEPQHGDW